MSTLALRNGLSGGGREWSPLRCFALRRAVQPGCTPLRPACLPPPGKAALAGAPAPSAPFRSPTIHQAVHCPGKRRESRGFGSAKHPWPGGRPRPFCSLPSERTPILALAASSSARDASGPRDPGNSRRCYGTRHLLRGAASPGARAKGCVASAGAQGGERGLGDTPPPFVRSSKPPRGLLQIRGSQITSAVNNALGGSFLTGLFRFRFQVLRLHLYFHLRWRPQKVFVCLRVASFPVHMLVFPLFLACSAFWVSFGFVFYYCYLSCF